ncbi:MAG: peptidase M15A [Halanaerobium sp.]|nr:MAG: peptidase M15A [Halanaerobium sp.]
MKKLFYLSIAALFILISSCSVGAEAFTEDHADFSIVYDELKIPLKTFSIFVLPREEIEVKIAEEDRNQQYIIELGGKKYESGSSFSWKAHGESGHYPVTISRKNASGKNSEIKLNVFVLHPYSEKEGEYIYGFKIGNYPAAPADQKEDYSKPKGFLKIEQSILDLNLTPHFKVEKFLTNQSDQLPQFIVIQESLLLKLEYFLAEVNKAGYPAETFGIVSFYRSPYFNKKIGNDTHYSRHLYGDAVDIYIDNRGNEWMDDLNGDGKLDIKDADVLFKIAKKFDQKEKYADLQGGLSSYHANGVRGSFIHIDTRGIHVTW